MSLQDARKHTVQCDFQHQLHLFSSHEAMEILGRTTAHIMARGDRDSCSYLANL
jgi:hypothetical protein